MTVFEAEIPCQAATSGVEDIDVQAAIDEQLLVVTVAQDRVLMTMLLNHGLPCELGRFPVRGLARQKLTHSEGLLGQPVRVLVAEHQFGQIGSKDCGATGLQHHDWCAAS